MMIKWVSTIENDRVIYECEFGYIKQDEEGWIFSALGKTCRPNSKELQIEQVQKHFEHCMKSIIKRANEVLGLVWTEEQKKAIERLKNSSGSNQQFNYDYNEFTKIFGNGFFK